MITAEGQAGSLEFLSQADRNDETGPAGAQHQHRLTASMTREKKAKPARTSDESRVWL